MDHSLSAAELVAEDEMCRRDELLFGMSFRVNGRRVDPRLVKYNPAKKEYVLPAPDELV